MAIDPFAGAPTAPAPDEAQAAPQEPAFQDLPAEAPAPAPAKKPAVATAHVDVVPRIVGGDGKVVLTFKGGSGYDAPWIVIHATSLDDALNQVSDENGAKLLDIMQRAQNAGQHFGSLAPAKAKASGIIGPGQRQEAPQAAQEAPNGEKRHCAHGEMKFVSQLSKKTGKPYKAFFCNSGDRNNECEAVFLR